MAREKWVGEPSDGLGAQVQVERNGTEGLRGSWLAWTMFWLLGVCNASDHETLRQI